MYFVASGKIAADHPDLEDTIGLLDEHLAHCADNAIRAESASDFIGEGPEIVDRLLREYVRQGAVTMDHEHLCRGCQHPLAATPDDTALWCDLCERRYSRQGITLTPFYRVSPDAERDQDFASNPASGDDNNKVLSILFIAGDRGGGARAQLDQPGEERALRNALEASANPLRFAFAAVVYAAGPKDLVRHIGNGPSIIHFVGHGNDRRLLLVEPGQPLVSHPIQSEHVQALLANAPGRVRLIYFNTCESTSIAEHLAKADVVDAAVGIPGRIGDLHAVNFAETFYRLVADGRSLAQAMAMSGVCLGDMRREDGPQLFTANDIDPQSYALV